MSGKLTININIAIIIIHAGFKNNNVITTLGLLGFVPC